jgi:hypothetical protein
VPEDFKVSLGQAYPPWNENRVNSPPFEDDAVRQKMPI